jgi:hypothetical protein
MNKKMLLLALGLCLGLLLGTNQTPVRAASPGEEPCSTVDFYVYNDFDGEIMFDLINWSIGERWLIHLDFGQEARFSMPEGGFEFWAQPMAYGQDWYLSDYHYFPACSRVATYIKIVKGEPLLRLKVFLPE